MLMSTALSLTRQVSASIVTDFISLITLESVNLGILSVRSTLTVFVLFVDLTSSLDKVFVCPIWLDAESNLPTETVRLAKMTTNLKMAIVLQESLDLVGTPLT